MAYDAHGTLVATLLTNAPGAGGTTFNVTAGTGALFPAVPFNCTVWTANTLPVRAASQLGIPNSALAEVVRVTNVAGDVLTVTRAQENTTAQGWAVGAVIGNTITALDITAIEALALGGTVTETGAVTSGHLAVFADNTGLVVKDGGAVPSSYTLPAATTTTLGGVIVPTAGNLAVDGSGNISVPTATSSVLGVVKPDNSSIVNTAGVLTVTPTSIGLGSVTNDAQTKAAIMPNTAPAAGQIPVGNAGGTAYVPQTISGKVSIASTGVASVSLVSSDVGLGNVTNDAQTKAAVVPNTAPAAGNILVGNAGGTAYAPVAMSGDATLTSAGVEKNTGFNGVALAVSSGTGGSSYGCIFPITVFVKSVTIRTTTTTNTDIATITLPAGITRWRAICSTSASAGPNSTVIAETASGTLAGAQFAIYDAATQGGTKMTATFVGPASAGTMVIITGNVITSVSTSGTVYINQSNQSANAGTCSFYFTIFPIP